MRGNYNVLKDISCVRELTVLCTYGQPITEEALPRKNNSDIGVVYRTNGHGAETNPFIWHFAKNRGQGHCINTGQVRT